MKAAQLNISTVQELAPSGYADNPRRGFGATEFSITVRNTSATTSVYLGGSDVTIANGFELPFGQSITVPLQGDRLYAVASAATVVHVLYPQS